MTDSAAFPPFIFCISIGNTTVFKIDILFFFSAILTIIYCIGLFLYLRRLDECLFFKTITRGCFTVNSCFGFTRDKGDDSSQGDSPKPAQDNQVISSEDDDSKNKLHEYSSKTTKNHCATCGQAVPAAQHASSSVIDPNYTMTINKDTILRKKLPSHAECLLLSLADHLELNVANLTQTEADDMLSELRTLRSTVGSRVPLFMQQINPPVDAFGPYAWYAEACLIDALIWLLKKRFPDRGDSQPEFSRCDQNKENKEREKARSKNATSKSMERKSYSKRSRSKRSKRKSTVAHPDS